MTGMQRAYSAHLSPDATGGSHHVEQVMGMGVSIDIRDPATATGTEAMAAVVQWLHHVDAVLSTHDENSLISQVGRGELAVPNSGDEIIAVLSVCEALRTETSGAFDVFEVPAPNGTRLDPSGYVKGWAIESAAGILERAGCRNFCINAGGDIAIRGRAADDRLWRVGIDHPHDRHSLASVLEVSGPVAIATSATYARGEHIIDPRTGKPARGLASATVVGPDLGLADAYATAIFVMGANHGLGWIGEKCGYSAMVITQQDEVICTDDFAHYLVREAVGR